MARSTKFRVRPLPRPDRPSSERRANRSQNAGTALELALSAASRRAGLDVMLLVDDAGMLVGSSHTELELAMVAAVTPIIGRGQALPRIKRDGEKRDMSVRPMQLQGEMLYMAAIGGSHIARRRELASSCAAANRILG
jgi:hypothetical protein